MLRKLKELWWSIDAAVMMWKVNRDPVARNAEPPADMYDNVMRMIRELEESKGTQ